MRPSYTTRSGRVVRPPLVPRLPLPPEESDDEEVDPTFDPRWIPSDDDESSSSSPTVDDEDEDSDSDSV